MRLHRASTLGRMPSTSTPAPRAPRSTLQWVDLVVAILLLLIVGLLGTVLLAALSQLSGLAQSCEGVEPDGARCSPVFLNAAIILGVAIVNFAVFLGAGAVIVRAVRRRVVFWVPLVAGVIVAAAYWVAAILLGTSYLPAG